MHVRYSRQLNALTAIIKLLELRTDWHIDIKGL